MTTASSSLRGSAGARSRTAWRGGWLVPLYRGVYRVGPVAAPYGAEMAAVLASGGAC